MIKKILKDVLGENFTENNEKYAKINFIIVILMFLVSAIMLFFLPEKINILHNGDTYYPTISHHLKVLAEGNLITSKKVGLEIYYSLNIEKYNVLSRWFQFLNDIENFKEKGIK